MGRAPVPAIARGAMARRDTATPLRRNSRGSVIENQLLDFHNHVRDNPFSQQYMWGAAANLNAQMARDLAIYFSMLPRKSANDY
jgi:cytochrome c553